MDRKLYQNELHNLLQAGQELNQRIRILMGEFGETANCAEWLTLGNVASSIGVANEMLFEALYPKPSALVDADA